MELQKTDLAWVLTIFIYRCVLVAEFKSCSCVDDDIFLDGSQLGSKFPIKKDITKLQFTK